MPVGGARPGAGRPRGRANQKTREIADKAAAQGMLPLEFLIEVMRDEANAMTMRLDAAKSAAPYMHPRLTNVDGKLSVDGKLVVEVVKFAQD